MAGQYWLAWALLSAVAAGLSVWHYRTRETRGRGRLLLAGLRAAAIALVLLLLFDPELRLGGVGAEARATQVLLDASLSMTLPAADGRSRWQHGVETARARAGGRTILLFGREARPVDAAALPDSAPGDAGTLLLPALQAAAEAGARRVVVVTDGGIEDAAAVERWLPRLGIELSWEMVRGEVSNRSLVEVTAPTWVESGAPFTVDFGVAGSVADSAWVRARAGDRVIGRTAVAPAGPGRVAAGSLEARLEAPPGGGWWPVVVELEEADVVPDDDRRTLYVHVASEAAGIVLVSLVPDWEPRFLAPVLEQALGLPLRGFLRGTDERWVRLGGGLDAGTPATATDVRRAVGRAELLVLHGVGSDAPDWALEALRSAPRLLVFPAGDGVAGLPVDVGPLRDGEFYPSSSIPASPVASLLAGQELGGVTPLTGLRSAEAPAGAWAPLLVARGRQGQPQPAVIAGQAGARRWAVALGAGYWQWSFRGGAERELYTRLWGAVGGWLVRDRGDVAGGAVRPALRSAPRGRMLAWVAPGLAADSVAIELIDAQGAVALDTTVTFTTADTAFTAPLPPGDYGYRARAFSGDVVSMAEGGMTVESWSPDFMRPAVDLSAAGTGGAIVRGGEAVRRTGTPLHTLPWPYILLVLLLATEWILRRRWGLR
jgi:hypothetical protein